MGDAVLNLSNGAGGGHKPTPPYPLPMEIPTPNVHSIVRNIEPLNGLSKTPMALDFDINSSNGGFSPVGVGSSSGGSGGGGRSTVPASFSPSSSHVKRDEYVCQTCSKTFRSKEGWKIHMERHEGKSRYHCTFCSRGFMAQTHLKAHLSEHTNELPCSCDQCGLKFKYPFTLKKHRAEAHPQ